MNDYEKIAYTVETILESDHPELGGFYYPVHADVTGIKTSVGECSIQILNKSGSAIEDIPPIPFVKIPTGLTIQIGTKVRIIFDYADLSHPVIIGVIK